MIMFLLIRFFVSSQVRVSALFMTHTRTGNPLVDSVAEHSPASSGAYWHNLRHAVYLAPLGVVSLLARARGPTDAGLFLVLFGLATYFFASKVLQSCLLEYTETQSDLY